MGYTLSDADVRVLNDLIDRVRVLLPSRAPTGPEEKPVRAPDLFVAKTPAGGIGPNIPNNQTGTGTGTAYEPGYADVQVYRVVQQAPGRYRLRPVSHIQQRVFNFGTTAVAGDTWVQVNRDRWGVWFVVTGGGGSGRRLARLTGKRYITGPDGLPMPAYSGEFVSQVGDPPSYVGTGEFFGIPNEDVYTGTQADIDTGTGTGTTVTGEQFLLLDPAFHIDNVDVPTPWVTEVWRGEGAFYLFGVMPRWEFVQQTDAISNVTSTAPGQLLRWDQNTKTTKTVRDIVLVWFPPPPPFP